MGDMVAEWVDNSGGLLGAGLRSAGAAPMAERRCAARSYVVNPATRMVGAGILGAHG
ncbi:hypothetical protein [Streptomyces sp. NPDC059272]|uniref:hypothetical protein n=1 Tax=Streptomyces sp. NPDC059272 TaxID=3346800 RepID=UPI003673782A